jgi:PAS domain S-box-containing protein
MIHKRIMIVEDETIIAMELEDRLLDLGYDVAAVVSSGEKAIQIVAEVQPDLIMMDIMLKGEMDGIQAATDIRSRFNIPIIYLTAYADEKTVQRAKMTEPFGYLLKPFEERELQITLNIAFYKHELETKLKQSEQWLAITLKSIGDAVIATDKEGSIVFMNPIAKQLTGWKESEALGQELSQVFHIINEETRRVSQNPVTKVLREGVIVGLANHTLLIAKDGTEIAIDDSAAPIKDENGNIIGVVLVFRDISQRRQQEEELSLYRNHLEKRVAERTAELARSNEQLKREINERKQAEAALEKERAMLAERVAERTEELQAANAQLSEAMRAKDEFLASMSHELRTPLNAVLGKSELMRKGVYGSLTERQHNSLHTIEESGRHLLALINDILQLAKIEAGNIKLENQTLSVSSVCEVSIRLILQQAQKKQIQVLPSFDNAVTTIQADGRRLKQILLNLLSNAVKFTPVGGQIGLQVAGERNDALPSEAAAGVVHFTVWDTGIGIAPEDMQRLFQRFVQVDSSLNRLHHGTGLGLALVRHLTEMHGGGITVKSEVGKGSRFTVSLPWHTPVDSANVVELLPADNKHSGRVKQVLILEDSARTAVQLANYLHELGTKTVIHQSGKRALQKAVALQPDLIILDLSLPHGNGTTLLTQLKSHSVTAEIPVLVMREPDQSQSIKGAADILIKPVRRADFYKGLRSCFSTTPQSQRLPKTMSKFARRLLGKEPLILLAEDNESNISTITDYLRFKGYRVTIARNGFEVLTQAREKKPQLILMDIQMPGLDGLEATRRLRDSADLAEIPIIALTALTMQGDRERCLKAGTNAYLSKPINFQKLEETMKALLGQTEKVTHPENGPPHPGPRT